MHTVRPEDAGQWTIDQLHRLPDDGNRYELVGGELFVTPPPSPGHQLISVALQQLLVAYVREHGLGVVMSAPNQLLLGNEKEEVQPDLMVIPTYWIVDEESRSIRSVQPGRDDVIATESLQWHPDGAAAPAVFDVAGLFDEALGRRA